MSGRIDAARKARGNHEALIPEIGRETAREFLAHCRAVAGTDDGHDGNLGELEPALYVEQGRRGVDLSESWRIPRLANDDQARPHALGRRKLALCFVLAAKADVVDAPTPARQRRQRIDGGFGAAEFVDQRGTWQDRHSRS
jgi:hypothetical protein